jgi:predicted dehydrogenase
MEKIGIVGYGYWGPNIVRNFNAQADTEVVYVSDLRHERLELVTRNYPSVKVTTNIDELISHVDAVVIATPVFTHFTLAKKALSEGKHVLVEKPMTASVKEALELINLSLKKNLVLMVDHTFLYTGAVQKIKSVIDNNLIGKINYIDSTRINLGLFQPDINVLWDLATHDISIVNHLISASPYCVQAVGISHTGNEIENIGYLTMKYNEDVIAHFNCSWTSPVKIRQFLIGGKEKMIVWDDMEPTEKIKIYDTSFEHKTDEDRRRILVDYRVGDIYVPKVPVKEALAGVAEDFINAINTGVEPLANYNSGLNVVKVLEAAQKSIKSNGVEVKIES